MDIEKNKYELFSYLWMRNMVLPILLGSSMKVVYQIFNNLEYPERSLLSDYYPLPTRIPEIDQSMMTIPLVVMISMLVYSYYDPTILSRTQHAMRDIQDQKRKLLWKKLVPKWLMGYAMFMLVYHVDNRMLMAPYQFDPSGHILCALVSYSSWYNIVLYTEKLPKLKFIEKYMFNPLFIY